MLRFISSHSVGQMQGNSSMAPSLIGQDLRECVFVGRVPARSNQSKGRFKSISPSRFGIVTQGSSFHVSAGTRREVPAGTRRQVPAGTRQEVPAGTRQ